MKLRRRTRRRLEMLAALLLSVGLVGTVAGVIIAASDTTPPPVSQKVADYLATPRSQEPEPVVPAEPPVLPADPNVLVIGDSFVQGHGIENTGTDPYPQLLADEMGWSGVTTDGVGGTGFLRTNDGGGKKFADRLEEMTMEPAPDLVLLQGSVNDIAFQPGELRTASIQTLKIIESKWPDAAVVVFGPITEHKDYEVVGNAYKSAASAVDAFYIDATGADTWLPKSQPELITEDGWHPSPAGHQAITAGLAEALRG